MKKIIYLFVLLIMSVAGFSQADDTAFYTKYPGIYGLQYPRMMLTKVLRPPTDTIYTKTGIARIGSTLWVGNGTLWTAAGSGGGGGVDSVTFSSGLATDTVLYWIGGTGYQAGIIDRKQGLLSGGIVHWDSLLVFTVSPAIYYIDGVRYTSPQTTITLDPADVSNPRIDLIGLDATGVIKITGTAASSPAEPQVTVSQIKLTSVLINTGATTPSGVSATTIYDENVEWTGSATGVTVNFNGATNVFHFLKTTDVSGFTNGQSLRYVNGSTVDLTTFTSLRFYIRLKATFAQSAQLQLAWMNGATVVSNTINLINNSYGYVRTTTGSYQVITIPIEDWALSTAAANTLRITLSGTNASGFYIDYITLVGGVTQAPSGGVVSVGSGWGTVFPTITTSGNVVVDSSRVTSREWDQKGKDSLAAILVPKTRTISTGFGLTGGGDLSANRTLIGDSTSGGFTSWVRTKYIIDSLNALGVFSAIRSLNGLTGATQTFATGTGGSDFNISSVGTTHTFNIPNASTTARGLVNTTLQSFLGTKFFTEGIQSTATSYGVIATGGTAGLIANNNSTSTNSIQSGILLQRNGSYNGATGNGLSIDFYPHLNDGSVVLSNAIRSYMTNVTPGSDESNIDIAGRRTGATEISMNIQPTLVRINNNADTLATLQDVRDAGGGGGGTNNANVGAGFRWLKPGPQEIKTSFAGFGILKDTTSNTDGITDKVDTVNVATKAAVDKFRDSLFAILNTTNNSKDQYQHHFDVAGGTNNGMYFAPSGTGSSITNFSPTWLGTGYGVKKMSLGTTTTGTVYGHYSPGLVYFSMSSAVRYNFGARVRLEDLSDGTNTYKLWLGFYDDHFTPPALLLDGVFFTYTHSESSGVFVCHTMNNGTETTASSGITVSADTEYYLQISVFGGEAKFYIDGTIVATISTNIPDDDPARTSSIEFTFKKSAGTTNRDLYLAQFSWGTISY